MNSPILSTQENMLRDNLRLTNQKLVDSGLNHGTTGNVSVRLDKNSFLITPSGIPAKEISNDALVKMDFAGNHDSHLKPSTEWRLHRDMLIHYPHINAVIHVHSTFATTLACLQRGIPAFHYMIAVAGGDSIRCARYALFGTQELSDFAIEAIRNRNACLLSHHGMIATGQNLNHAFSIAMEVETLCEQYWRVLQIGEPPLLSEKQMQEVIAQFKNYGQWKSS